MITEEDRERVRQATDVLQLVGETVELRRRGADYWGCCPFHHEKSPSFHVNPQTGLWKCFGCGLGGDVFGYVMHRENLEFPDAIRFLADRAGIELVEERGARRGPKRNRLIECLGEAQRYYETILFRGKGNGPAQAREYLAGRGFGSAVCRSWHLGYAPGHGMLRAHLEAKGFSRQEMEAADLVMSRNATLGDRFFDRVMFPICDEQGRTIGFGGRVMGDAKPKYLNTKETSVFHKGKHLFAFNRAKEHIAARGEAIVCEGYTDVIALHEAGYPIAVAALGTSFSIDHVRALARFAKKVICMFDGDAAGQRAAERAIRFLDKSEADLRCVVLPGGQDPAEFLDSHRASDLQPILDRAEPLMDFVLRKRLADTSPMSPAGVRVAKLDEIAAVLAPLGRSVVIDGYAMEVAGALGLPKDDVLRAVRSKYDRSRQEPDTGRFDSYEAYPEAQGAAATQWDAGPAEAAYGGAGVPYTADERRQLQAELELLSLMATNIDLLRPYAERIASLAWVDARHEAMAWAMLATPDGTAAADVVRAACEVVRDAPGILASGTVAASDGMDEQTKAQFVLDTVELYSTRRKIGALRSQLRSGAEVSTQAFRDATMLQQHANELANRLSGFEKQ